LDAVGPEGLFVSASAPTESAAREVVEKAECYRRA
jgi:hypothetical protein